VRKLVFGVAAPDAAGATLASAKGIIGLTAAFSKTLLFIGGPYHAGFPDGSQFKVRNAGEQLSEPLSAEFLFCQ
jgi:hypothetical protein